MTGLLNVWGGAITVAVIGVLLARSWLSVRRAPSPVPQGWNLASTVLLAAFVLVVVARFRALT